MKIQDFWNQAFLAALTRLPAGEAKEEAHRATQLCIEQWQSQRFHWAPQNLRSWQEQDICHVPYDPQEVSQSTTLAAPEKT